MLKFCIPKVCIRIRFVRSVSFSSEADIYNILTTHLKVNTKTVDRIFQLPKLSIINIPKKQLIQNCEILRTLEHLVSCLKLNPIVTENRIMLLEEMGVKNICVRQINVFNNSMRGSIKEFKRNHNIPQEQCIISNMFSSVGLNKSFELSEDKYLTMVECYVASIIRYKMHHLKLTGNLSLQRKKPLKYQSFRRFTNTLNILEKEFQFSRNILSKCPLLLILHSADLSYFLSEMKDVQVGGIPMLEIVKKDPHILCADLENVKELLTLFKELNIPDQAILRSVFIFKMQKDEFLRRYQKLMSYPEISMWSTHPHIIHLIVAYKRTVSRIEELRLKKRMDGASIHTIASDYVFFQRYLEGIPNRSFRNRLLSFIVRENFGPDKLYLLKYIQRHPNWKKVSVFSLGTVLRFLKERYLVEDICQNIHILLYPMMKVVEAHEKMYREYSTEKGYSFTPSQYLALCVYILEKENHFNGDAIFNVTNSDNDLVQIPDLEDEEEDETQSFNDDVYTLNQKIR